MSKRQAKSKSAPVSKRWHTPLEQSIEAERAQLMQAEAVLKCLYEVLLYADDDEAVRYADVVRLAGKLIEDVAMRLDLVQLRPLIEALKRDTQRLAAGEVGPSTAQPPPESAEESGDFTDGECVREEPPKYLH
jgi:hypothetical protein